VGYAGLLDLGYVAFAWVPVVGLAGSLGRGLYPPSRHSRAAPAHLAIIPAAALVAGIFRCHLERAHAPGCAAYLAIVTLGFGEIIRVF
jgi:ABC-type branched-subunit amino acid transport system permease subunit